MPDEWTIGRLLAWTTDYLKKQGAESPRLDAEILLAAARGCQRIDLYTSFDQVTDEKVRTEFRELVRRRAEGAPVAYLVGRKEFYSLAFRVTPDVLIPRPETELLVVRLFDLMKERGPERQGASIVDVGTGSGIIAICAARNLAEAQVATIDVSPAALAVARENAATHGVAERIEWFESDLFAAVPAERRFDFVVSNPPYVSSAEFAKLSPTVKNFEPRVALEAGPHGTEVIERLIPAGVERLTPGGWLLMEISPVIEAAVSKLLHEEPKLEPFPTIKDLANLPRIVQAKKR